MPAGETAEAPPLNLERLVKRYGAVTAVEDVSLVIPPGRFLTLLGPSGSGKTTLLMMIAGFVGPTAGRVLLGARDITGVPPERRNFGMVFQGYALFPNMTVADNIAFPLSIRRRQAVEIRREVERMLELVELGGLGARLPRQLSGGQQQRVALARALVFKPPVLLLDEPLSALDKNLRAGLQQELRDLNRRLGTTFVLVTHDQEEALSMSDEIAIINHGRLIQHASPAELYERPLSRFAAGFLGKSNFIEGEVKAIEGGTAVYAARGITLRQRLTSTPVPQGAPILVALRPEKIAIGDKKPWGGGNAVEGRVRAIAFHGGERHIRLETALGVMEVVQPTWRSAFEPTEGGQAWLSWEDDASVVLLDDR